MNLLIYFVFFYFLHRLSFQINIELETNEYVYNPRYPKSTLWLHTSSIINQPYNLTELKICLLKSFIQDRSPFPIYKLAKYTLFGYPKVDEINKPKSLTFCHDYQMKSQEHKKFQRMIKENPLDDFKNNFSLSFLYFIEADRLGHKNAPSFIYFLLNQNLIFHGVLEKNIILYPNENYLSDLLTIGSNRGSYLSKLIILSETLSCYKLKNNSYYEPFSNFIKTNFSEFFKGPNLSIDSCRKCSEILNIALILGSESLMFLQQRGGEGSEIPLFENTPTEQITEKSISPLSKDLYSDEIYILQSSARSGNTAAQLALGEIFMFGNPNLNVPRDLNISFYYLNQAASNNVARSFHHMGLMYTHGIGKDVNGTIARENFEKAIELGLEDGYSGLGFLYLHGIGVKKNISLAIEHFEKAVAAGNVEAESNLGAIYLEELKNEKLAVAYFSSAAKKKHLSAMFNLGILYMRGVKTNITCEDVLENILEICAKIDKLRLKEKAFNFYKQGNFEKSLLFSSLGALTGNSYHYKNMEFLLKTAKNKICKYNDDSLCRLAYLSKGFLIIKENENFGLKLADLLFSKNQTIKNNYNISFFFYEKLENFSPEARYSLSYMYEYGFGVEKNLKKSKNMIMKNLESAWKAEISFEHFWPALITNIKLEIKEFWERIFGNKN